MEGLSFGDRTFTSIEFRAAITRPDAITAEYMNASIVTANNTKLGERKE